MSTFYNKSRQFYLKNLNLDEIILDLENNFKNDDKQSLNSFKEANELYELLLENAGKISADFIAPRAEEVDEKSATHKDGVVEWADATKENMKVLAQAGYMGGTLDRKYGGLNLPVTVNTVIIEMVSQADASLMNLFGLQDIGVTISKFATEEQKDRVLPKFCSGEVSGSMALTEPDAGSDLQAVGLRAVEKDGEWYLDGVKRFITNGSGDVSLVLARSEDGSKGGRGLSMFLYERYRDDNMIVRRIENKLGIHGSPTCELQFNMAKTELVGKRKFGLIKYVMSLMNGARLGVSAQAMGIAEAAYHEALKYAKEREQFGKAILDFPAVYQMLKKMQVEVETSRLLLYHTALSVDYYDMYERKEMKGENVKDEIKKAKARADFLTPLSKFTITEMANKVTYDAIQIHGGVGYMKDFPVERLARDARITNIYEGTTQLQVVAAIGGIKKDILAQDFEDFSKLSTEKYKDEQEKIIEYITKMRETVNIVSQLGSKDFYDYTATYLVEMSSILFRLVHLLPLAEQNTEKENIFAFFYTESVARLNYLLDITMICKERYGETISSLKDNL